MVSGLLQHCPFLISGGFPSEAGNDLPGSAVASVSLPPELFAGINKDFVGVFFGLYTEPTLFPVRLPSRTESDATTLRSEVASPIVAATVGPGLNFSDVDPPVMINLRLNDIRTDVSSQKSTEYSNDSVLLTAGVC